MTGLATALADKPQQTAAILCAVLVALRRIDLALAKVPGEIPKLSVAALVGLFVYLRNNGLAFGGKFATAALKYIALAAFGTYLADLAAHFYQRLFKGLPPGPVPMPLVGSLHLMIKQTDPDGAPLIHRVTGDMLKDYGPIYGMYLGSYYTVIIGKPDIAKEAFVTKGLTTSDRCAMQSHGGHHVPSMFIATRDGQGIAMSTGRYWRKVRTALETNISRQAPAERNAPIVMREVESFVCAVRNECQIGDGTIGSLTGQLKRESMNIATTLLFSTRFGRDLPEDFQVLKHSVEYIFKNLSSGNASDMIPVFRAVPSPFLREFQRVVTKRDEVLGRIIKEHRQKYDDLKKAGQMKERSDCRDLVDQFFMDQDAGQLTADELHVVVWDILFAMTDTSASTNEWLVYYLVSYPEVQRKVHEEIDREIGHERLPTLADRERLPYFWAVIKEIMRIRTISPVLAPHYCSKDTQLSDGKGNKYTLPTGTAIFVNAWSMALDEELWGPDAKEFRPERWLEDERNKGLDLHGKEERASTEHYKYIPFSLGQRNCPGYSFAKVVTFMQAVTIAQCFEWKLSEKGKNSKLVKDGKLDLQEFWGLTIMPHRHGDEGLIAATIRPAAALANPLPGDFGALVAEDRILEGVGASDRTAAVDVPLKEVPSRKITATELAKHNTESSCWIAHQGVVYDATKWLPDHPGGAAQILDVAGRDATREFNDVGHSDTALKTLAGLAIGRLVA